MLDEPYCLHLHPLIQHYHPRSFILQKFKMNELMDSDDEKPHRGKTRRWVKRRSDRGYFNNIIKELRVEDRTGFRDMFQMDVANFEYIITKISMLLALFSFALPCL